MPRKLKTTSPTKQVTPQTSTVQPQQPTDPSGVLYFLLPSTASIDDDCIEKVKSAVSSATLKNLRLIVHSNGGDPYSAVKIIRILRTKFEHISGFVPFSAMSAATLMLLGAHEIYMSEESQLGPLDLPMEHPKDGSTISSLDVVNTLNQISSSAMEMANEMFKTMRDDLDKGDKIGKTEAMKMALGSAVEMVKPIIEQIDPYQRQKAFRRLKIGQWYAYDLLRTGMFKGRSSAAWRTARSFVHSFPDHSYAIFREDATGSMLNLTIKESTSIPEWDTIVKDVATRLNKGVTVIDYSQ